MLVHNLVQIPWRIMFPPEEQVEEYREKLFAANNNFNNCEISVIQIYLQRETSRG